MARLFQINITANWGSHGRIAEELGQLAIQKGWESYIAYGRWANTSKSYLIHIGNTWDERFHALQTRLLDNHGLASKRATRKLIEKIVDIHPDIIHLHNIHGYYLNYPLLFDFLSKSNVPVIWTFHDCWPFTGHCTHPTYIRCVQWREHCIYPCALRGEYPTSWFVDKCTRNYTLKKEYFNGVDNLHIVTVSKWLEGETRKSFLKGKDIRCIYNGIDTNIFMPVDYDNLIRMHNISKNEKVILGVASIWEKRKGLFEFYKIRDMLPSNYRIILIGLSDKQIKSLPAGILGLRRTNSQNELAAYYSMADVYVNPSQAETFGMTTAEALSCGTPSIVYNTTACPELVSSETGAVVKFEDVSAMAHAIQKICNISTLEQEEIRKQCRQRAVKLFDKKDRYQEYLNLYNSLLK